MEHHDRAARGRSIEIDERGSAPSPTIDDDQRLRVFLGVMHEFANASSDYEVLLETVARRCSEVLRCDCVISLLSDDGRTLDQVAHKSLDDEVGDTFETLSKKVSLRRDDPHPAWTAVDSGRPEILVIHDARLRARFPDPVDLGTARALGLHSGAVVPLKVRGTAIGTLSLVRSRSNARAFDESDLALAVGFADHAALAIANARLLRDAKRELRERRTAEAALRSVEEQLRQSQKMDAIGQLAGGVAHDFNNLLSVILGYSAFVLENVEASESLKHDVREIHSAAQRATQLTRQLLSLSRQSATERRVVVFDEVVRPMDTMIRRVVGEEIRIITRLACHATRVKVDPSHVEQVLTNLVVNARDAMPDGGQLTIETARVVLDDAFAAAHLGVVTGPHVRLLVRDSGIGMDDATRARIFEPFFTTKEVGKGTGLGLSTVFGLVRKNGGTIQLESVPGAGTTFEIYFRTTDAEPTPARSIATNPGLHGTETILLVEDEAKVRSMTRTVLQRHGYHVLEACDGLDALRVSEEHTGAIDLLVTDIVMPSVGGPALVPLLRELRPGIPVIFVSGYAPDGPHSKFDAPLDGPLISKPFPPETLLHAIRDALADAPAR